MLRQALPKAASEYAAAQQRESRRAVARALVLWRQIGADFDPGWLRIAPLLMAGVEESQSRVATGSLAYIPDVLEETGQTRAVAAFAEIDSRPLIGVAGDGRPLDSLLYGAVTHSRERVAAGVGVTQALQSGGMWLAQAVSTVLSDTGRQGESLGMGVRPVAGFVRMLNPPSCSRCVILAGKWYRKNTGFQRHPRCDCRHIPAAESMAGDLRVDGFAYVDSLSEVDQNRLLGKAGADAWRAGGDLNQIVNARRSMYTAQGPGVRKLYTREGMATRRGWAYTRRTAGLPPGSSAPPRLMPESIALIARNQDEYLRLLRTHGYILRTA